MDTSIKLHPNWILFLQLRCPCGHFQHEVVCWFFLLASSTAKLDQEYQPCGGFHKWVYPKTDRLQWKVPNKNGWFKGTPIFGNLYVKMDHLRGKTSFHPRPGASDIPLPTENPEALGPQWQSFCAVGREACSSSALTPRFIGPWNIGHRRVDH